MDIALKFEQDNEFSLLVGYIDSNFAGNLDKHYSTIGYLFALTRTPVNWKSTLQSPLALSATKAEYMVVTKVIKKMIRFLGLLDNFGSFKNS